MDQITGFSHEDNIEIVQYGQKLVKFEIGFCREIPYQDFRYLTENLKALCCF